MVPLQYESRKWEHINLKIDVVLFSSQKRFYKVFYAQIVKSRLWRM